MAYINETGKLITNTAEPFSGLTENRPTQNNSILIFEPRLAQWSFVKKTKKNLSAHERFENTVNADNAVFTPTGLPIWYIDFWTIDDMGNRVHTSSNLPMDDNHNILSERPFVIEISRTNDNALINDVWVNRITFEQLSRKSFRGLKFAMTGTLELDGQTYHDVIFSLTNTQLIKLNAKYDFDFAFNKPFKTDNSIRRISASVERKVKSRHWFKPERYETVPTSYLASIVQPVNQF